MRLSVYFRAHFFVSSFHHHHHHHLINFQSLSLCTPTNNHRRILAHVVMFQMSSILPRGEPWLTFLMPLYSAVSWILLVAMAKNGHWMLPVSAFGAFWALRNIMVTGAFDLGVVTMGFTAALDFWTRTEGSTEMLNITKVVGCCLVAGNFAIPVVFWHNLRRRFKAKSQLWQTVFKNCCIASSVFWLVGAFCTYCFRPVSSNSS